MISVPSLWSTAGAIAAICRNTLLAILRERVPFALVIFIALLAPALSIFAEGDGTLLGLLRVVTTYNFTIQSVFLTLLILYLSATALDAEVYRRQIWLIDAKPVPRWAVVVGKWAALALLSAWLLLVMGCVMYMAIMAFVTIGGRAGRNLFLAVMAAMAGILIAGSWLTSAWERRGRSAAAVIALWLTLFAVFAAAFYAIGQRWARQPMPYLQEQRLNAYRQFVTCRASFPVEMPNIDAEVEAYRQYLKNLGKLDERLFTPEELYDHLREQLNKKHWPIPYGGARAFVFRGLPRGSEAMTLRYKLYGRRGEEEADWLHLGFEMANPESGLIYREEVPQYKGGSTREINFSGPLVASDGTLMIAVYNLTGPKDDKPPAVVSVPLEAGLEMLIPAGVFEANLLRGLALLWVRFAMLAALGLAASTFLRGSVAAFFLIGIIASGLANDFLVSQFSPSPTRYLIADPNKPSAAAEYGQKALRAALRMLPDFAKTDPTKDLLVGREITLFDRLLPQAAADLLLRAGIFFGIGLFVFTRREVGLPRL